MNGVALGKIADVHTSNGHVQRAPVNGGGGGGLKRRESSDSGYEQDETVSKLFYLKHTE